MAVLMTYVDDEGMPRQVWMPETGGDPRQGIPHSLDIDSLFMDTTPQFRRKLYEELWARGLVAKEDFLKPRAPELIRSALLATVKQDTFSILALARG